MLYIVPVTEQDKKENQPAKNTSESEKEKLSKILLSSVLDPEPILDFDYEREEKPLQPRHDKP